MDLDVYVLPLKKWWWLLVAATVVAGITSLFVVKRQPPVYQAHTTLMVGQTIENPNPNSGDFYLEQSLAGAYADMAYREPVRNAVMGTLGLTWLPDYISQAVPNSQLLEIQVTDSNPQRALLVTNELAHQLILRSPTGASSGDQNRTAFINDQLNSLQSQITDTEAQINTLQTQLGEMTSAKQIADTQAQINALQGKLTTLQANYANMLSNTQKGAINSLSVIEPAELPAKPINQSQAKVVLLAALIGLVLAAGGAYGIEFFDRTLKTEADIQKVFKAPVLAYIAEMNDKGNEWLYVIRHPGTLITEAFRSLRVYLDLARVEKPLNTLYVSSISPSSGKTIVSINLAFAYANAGERVLLIEADLYRPRLHEIFGLPIGPGLSDVIQGHSHIDSAISRVKDHENLMVMTAGNLLEKQTESGLWNIDRILPLLEERASIIILDGPPFMVADAPSLASKVDGVLLIVRPGQIRQDVAMAAMEQLDRSNTRVVGVVFNRISRQEAGTYGQYSYYYSPYSDNPNYFLNSQASGNGNHKPKGKVENNVK